MKHGLAMAHAARQKAEERCEQETRLRVNAERQVAALEAEIARLQDARRALLATTAAALASNLTRFSQSLSSSQQSESPSMPHAQVHTPSLVNRNPDHKGKGRAGATATEMV